MVKKSHIFQTHQTIENDSIDMNVKLQCQKNESNRLYLILVHSSKNKLITSTSRWQWEWKYWYSFLLSTEIHQWFRLLIESKLTQWNINKHIFITTKMNKKFMFWLLWMKVDEKIIKWWEKMKMISSIEIIRLWFQKMIKWMIWWVENENKLEK